MAKHWFLDYFGAAVAKSVVRDCCRDMARVRGWVERNLGRFRPTEIIGMYRFLAQKRQAIE